MIFYVVCCGSTVGVGVGMIVVVGVVVLVLVGVLLLQTQALLQLVANLAAPLMALCMLVYKMEVNVGVETGILCNCCLLFDCGWLLVRTKLQILFIIERKSDPFLPFLNGFLTRE